MDNLSSVVWDKLNQFIGSREKVFIRQTNYEVLSDIDFFTDKVKEIPSGSKAEGLDLPGSDYDFMYVHKTLRVKPRQCNDTPNADLIIETDNIKPGFCKLYLSSGQTGMEKLGRGATALTPFNGRLYLSSLLFRDIVVENTKAFNPDAEPHGPCATYKLQKYSTEIDRMVCLACKYWPTEANEWLKRQRVNNWPALDLVSNIVEDGVLIVPIGNPLSEKSHMEWRISYSLAEKKLVHSMNHSQILCYGLLKLYLKHVIESREGCTGLLCSYFLKTALFYCIEEENIVWDKNNFITCFWTCFKRLLLWIREGYCPNYFTKTNNMFESKIFGDNRKKLQEHCFRLYENGMDTFVRIPILSNLLCTNMLGPRAIIPNAEEDYTKTNEFNCDMQFLSLYSILWRDIDFNRVQELLYSRHLLSLKRVRMLYHIRKYQIDLTQRFYHYIVNTDLSNKSKYKQLQILSRYILNNCRHFDICTGWLQFATMCYLNGHYSKVVSTVEYVLKQFKPFVLYGGSLYVIYSYGTEYIKYMCGKGFTIEYKHKTALARAFVCSPNWGFYPSEIDDKIKQHQDQELSESNIPPRVYGYVLLFLAWNKMQEAELRDQTLHRLIKSTEDKHFIGENEIPMVSALVQRCVEIASNNF